MAQSKIAKIESRIRKEGFNWVPGDTPVGRMSKANQDRHLGLKVEESEMLRVERMLAEFARAPGEVSYANRVDWRVKDGENWVTDIKDQGNCGSCVAFASLATLETQTRIQEEKHGLPLDLSEAELFFRAGRRCSQGWWPSEALEYIKMNGVCDEDCFPYVDRDTTASPCSARDERFLKIGEWQEIVPVGQRKAWLDDHGPLVACMAVYRDFFNYKDGVYRPTSDELAGYHAIACVGYSEEEQCWICKNSWGEAWGDDGFFKIGYGTCDIDTRFAMFGVAQIFGPLLKEDTVFAWAESTVFEDSLKTGRQVFWAYVDGKWLHKELSHSECGTAASIVESSGAIQVEYMGDEILTLNGWRSYEEIAERMHFVEAA